MRTSNNTITLLNHTVTLQVPQGCRYCPPAEAEKLLVDIWGNPPGRDSLGMIIADRDGRFTPPDWAILLTYTDGRVNAPATPPPPDSLLAAAQQRITRENRYRFRAGFPKIQLLGWIVPPTYEKTSHCLYWAEELLLEGQPTTWVNHHRRILGRNGVLALTALATKAQLSIVETVLMRLAAHTRFNIPHQYEDIDDPAHRATASQLEALVAGPAPFESPEAIVHLQATLAAAKQFIHFLCSPCQTLFLRRRNKT